LLDQGKEAEAKVELAKAQRLDPDNVLAKTLRHSITADPAAEIGEKTFRYTVKRGETLSKIADVYLKNQYKFYLLARYNNIPVPRNLPAGAVIRVPGTKPLAPPLPNEDRGVPRADRFYEDGLVALKAGQKETAYGLFTQAGRSHRLAVAEADRLRVELVQTYERRAREARRAEDLDSCIANWDRVITLDPNNELAKLERQRAVELREILRKRREQM
jgi:hypothetical protein